jgi:hypothetical protein
VAQIELAEIEDALAGYLQAAVLSRFDWRRRNCHAFAGDWMLQVRGVDPGAEFRNRCSTPAGAIRLIRRAGFRDLAECTAARMAAVAIAENDPAAVQIGDVGIIMMIGMSDTPQQTLAIAARSGWAALAPRGLTIAKGRALRAWSIGKCLRP